ncbi:excinuclease ABC subunit B [Arsenicitalea aurantiaca]|uniref:Excinuclease ABC subunit B n=1 Tax=Arsenicitalea aurantiaca TaxID=1783274 RepID=A0A433XKQ8_9HYPH|nr:UvrB/UvrC motif-containing protein [Arsenicitalea aurantiaca]RUT34604.1 excinuclease ABC subunit B [Arsenicitalea aurantiaca]
MSSTSINRRIEELERRMQAAAEAEDFELAARLRDELQRWKGEAEAGTPEVRQPPPGQMGLGTHVPVVAPPTGWTRPKKPDPMTAGHKPRGKR